MQRGMSMVMVLACLLSATAVFGQWEPDQRLTNDSASSKTAENSNTWTVAASGDTVHVVWTDERHGTSNDAIYYKRSTDRGATWGSDVRLRDELWRSWCPSVAVAGSSVHVVWEDNRSRDWFEIYYRRSTDGGATWLPEILFPLSPRLGFEPSVAVSGNNVHVVWDGLPSETGGPLEVYYRRSTDAGASWGSVTRLTNDTADYAWQPSVAVSGSYVHVAWYDGRHGPGNPAEIYCKRSTDGGASWGSDVRLTNSAPNSQWTSIAAAGDDVHVVWSDLRDGGANEIYYKRSTDRGTTWPASPGGDRRLTPADGKTSYFPSVAAAADNVHVVWCDNRDSSLGDEVYYIHSTDRGANWSQDTSLTASDNKQSRHPSIAVAGAALHVVWYDNRDGNYEIYYKRNLTGQSAAGEPWSGQQRRPRAAGRTIVRGVLFLPKAVGEERPAVGACLLDAAGRKVLVLKPGPNDVSYLAPGVYFVREYSAFSTQHSAPSAVRKVVVAGQ